MEEDESFVRDILDWFLLSGSSRMFREDAELHWRVLLTLVGRKIYCDYSARCAREIGKLGDSFGQVEAGIDC